MERLLPESFFERPTLDVAYDLLGKVLCRKLDENVQIRSIILEVEAYDGPDDRACHAFKGKTLRNAVMFGPAGYWYVYLCYGIHWMLNIVTGPIDYPAAILIRGTIDAVGPGRLTRHFNIDKKFNFLQNSLNSNLWIEDSPISSGYFIITTPRIGIDYAGPIWSAKPYRYVLVKK